MNHNIGEFVIRLCLLFLGLVIAHFGVALFLLSDLGADPFNVLVQGIRLLIYGCRCQSGWWSTACADGSDF